MRPCLLEFCSVNSFSEPARVDFRDLLSYGIFGVFGDTGSGKSTILDCITFALYGSVYRSRTGTIADIIHYDADRAYVNFEFEIVYEQKRRTFRVERELKRKNAAQSVKVYEREGDCLRVISDGVRESNELLERIIGLEQKDFEKCIALPQGEFAQFVKASRVDRLKLIARLFDLEGYGEKLFKKVNARCASLRAEYDLASARMEAFENVSEEALSDLRAQVAELQSREAEERTALETTRREEKTLSELLLKKLELEKTQRELDVLAAEQAEIDALEQKLGRFSKAQAVVSAARESERQKEQAETVRREASLARTCFERAEEAEKQYASFDEERVSEEIETLSARRVAAQQAEERRSRLREGRMKLEAARRAYAEELKSFPEFSYEKERAEIEARLNALKEEDFSEYFKRHADQLFREEYKTFWKELCLLREKYPKAEDLLPLIEKYRALSEGESESYEKIRLAYEQTERERKRERENLLALEKRNGLYQTHRARLQQLQTEGTRLKEELSLLEKTESPEETADKRELDLLIERKKFEKRRMLEGREQVRRERERAAVACACAEEKRAAAAENLARANRLFEEALLAGEFSSAEEARRLSLEIGNEEQAKSRVSRFRERIAFLNAKREQLSGVEEEASQELLTEKREKLKAEEELHENTLKDLALKQDALSRVEENLSKKKSLLDLISKTEKDLSVAERLKSLLEGNKFMEFVAEEYLESVTSVASKRLLQLTSGRYFLRYEHGFFVGDNLAGGRTRAVYTLSGGETFLVSLSLALALSAQICGKSLRPIEFFFLDEGFGTLDERLVDTVMDSLEKLKGEHFSIGIISHVEELKHRIEKKLLVEKANERHGSRITVN